MIPVRTNQLPVVLNVFQQPGPALAGRECPACDEQYTGPVVLVGIGPGPYPADQAKARDGRWHTGAAVAVHAACAGAGPDGQPVAAAAEPDEPNAEDTAQVGEPDPTPDTEPFCEDLHGTDMLVGPTCTRRPGHSGQHLAGDGDLVRAVWT